MFSYKSLLSSLFLSSFIYLAHFGIEIKFINTLFALMGIYSLFILTKRELFVSGFLTSVLWFWWISKSFVFYDLSYLIPVIILVIGVCYGVLFYLIGLFENLIYKLVFIFMLTFINPFGFNWFKLELPFINSYLGTSKIEFFLILLTFTLFIYLYKRCQKQSLVFLVISILGLYSYNYINSNLKSVEKPDLKILQYDTVINQAIKWKPVSRSLEIQRNIEVIKQAINDGYDLVVFPETAFPIVLNKNDKIEGILFELSKKVSIVTGALYEKDDLYYNSTYFYENGKREVAHKVVLVPFGEAVPMPEKIRDMINNLFYNGAKDYETAKEPTTFNIKGVKFRNAICYEITTNEIYQNLDTPYIIAISNNAWFTPSIEPILQKLLMQYYAKRYHLYYIDVTNSF